MWRRALTTLTLVLLVASPGAARSKRTAGAVAAANAAKNEFHDRNAPASFPPPAGLGVANRSVKVLVAARLEDGTLALTSHGGESRGTLDPVLVPEIISRRKNHFAGRRRLEPADLEVGQLLKVVYFGTTSEVLRVKVLGHSASSGD